MKVKNSSKHAPSTNPETLWRRRLVLSIVEFAVFLVGPFEIFWGYFGGNHPTFMIFIDWLFLGPTSIFQYVTYYSLPSARNVNNAFLILGTFWWMIVTIFLPFLIGLTSALATRRDMKAKSPVKSLTTMAAKVAAALPLLNCIGFAGLQLYAIGGFIIFTGPLAVLPFAIYHAWISFEGWRFRADDFKEITLEPVNNSAEGQVPIITNKGTVPHAPISIGNYKIGGMYAHWIPQIILGILEFLIFLAVPLVVGSSSTTTGGVGFISYYLTIYNPPSSYYSGFQAGAIVLIPGFFFQLFLPGDWVSYPYTNLALYWWFGTAICLPLLLGVRSSLAVRRSIKSNNPIQPPTNVMAMISPLLAIFNALGVFLLWVLFSFSFNTCQPSVQCWNQEIFAFSSEVMVAPFLIIACALCHLILASKGRR